MNLILFYVLSVLMLIPIFYFYFTNYSECLRLSLSEKSKLGLASALAFVLFFSVLIGGNFWEKTLFLLSPLVFAYYFKKKSNEESYWQIVTICLFLNVFHLIGTCLGDVLSGLVYINSPATMYLSSFIAYSTQFLCVFLLSRVLKKPKVYHVMMNLIRVPSLKQSTLTVGILLTGIWIFFFYHYYARIYALNSPNFSDVSQPYFTVVLIVTLVLSLFFAITSYLQFTQEQLQNKENLLLQQQSYIYILEELQNDIRTFQHDYKNVLASLYLQVQDGDIDSIRAFMKDHIYSFESQTSLDMKQLNALNNVNVIEIKSLFITKIFELQAKGISLNLEVFHPVDHFQMEVEDTARCLGILLDNAIEAVETQTDPTISLVLFEENNVLTFVLKNSIEGLCPNQKKKLEEAGYSTKGKNRGLGLYSYQRIAEKYSNLMRQTIITENEFQQVMKIQRVS